MKKVLMVSSSAAFLSRNANLLTDKGFHFSTAKSVTEALKLHDEHQFDLILSDLELDGMNGCSLCSAARKNDSQCNVPVIIICRDSTQHIQLAKQSDAAAILLRPVNPTHMLITIGSFIDMQLARSKRVEFTSTALLKKAEMELLCNTCDISATGIRLITEFHLDLGDVLNCKFSLFNLDHIQTAVKVIRCNESTKVKNKNIYGLRFIDLPLASRNSIDKYVSLNDHLGVKQKPHRPLERSLNFN